MDPEELIVRLEDPTHDRRRLTVRGDLDMESAPALQTAIADNAGPGTTLLVLDLREVEFVDSSAIRVILRAANEFGERGGRLVIDGLSPAVRRVFEVTGLLERLKADGDRDLDD